MIYIRILFFLFILFMVDCHQKPPVMNDDDDSILSFNNVFDWVFGDPEDESQKHELEEHFGYIRGNQDDIEITKLATTLGIKPEFFNFKAHDYDDNDMIDGNELLKMILIEKETFHPKKETNSPEERKLSDYIELCTKTIDRLLQKEDLNNDGFLDFMEYSKARSRIEKINLENKLGSKSRIH